MKIIMNFDAHKRFVTASVATMNRIATYVFLDLETTGLPSEECNKTKIIELSMVAVKREHVLETRPGLQPRIVHKLTRCFNPLKRVSDGSTEACGLDNFLLEHEHPFDVTACEMINHFLNTLTKPICLIAQNGLNFDFPILRRHLEMLHVSFPNDILCADSYHGFYDILEAKKNSAAVETTVKDNLVDEVDLSSENTLSMKSVNETTPKQVKPSLKRPHADKVKRRFPWGPNKKPTDSYRLSHIYERVLNRPANDAHRAENDCMFVLEIAVALGEDFATWVDNNHMLFADIRPMTIGVRLGE